VTSGLHQQQHNTVGYWRDEVQQSAPCQALRATATPNNKTLFRIIASVCCHMVLFLYASAAHALTTHVSVLLAAAVAAADQLRCVN
jgi:phosphatidylglycerophosphate synthase